MKDLYSTKEAAQYVGISTAALKYHIYEGENVTPQKIGHSLVFTREQLDRFLENKRDPGRPRKE